MQIRPAEAPDVPVLLALIRELAAYERAEHEALATPELLHRALFAEDAVAHAVIIEDAEGACAGFALYFFNFSTWTGRPGLFLEDLFVRPEFRGQGYGKSLLTHLAGIAVERGCGRYEWNVLDWNQPAIDFYESLGAKPQHEWVGYRLSGEALNALAGKAGTHRGDGQPGDR